MRMQHNMESLDMRWRFTHGEWRMLTTAAMAPIGAVHGCDPLSTFVNGALHWVAFRKTNNNKFLCFVMVFDLREEVFHEIGLPKVSDNNIDENRVCVFISAYQNSLAMFYERFPNPTLNIWVMKNYADASSWTKFVISAYQGPIDYNPRVRGFRKNGEVILEMNVGHFVSQDLNTKESKDLGINGDGYTFVGSYVKRLVLLDKPNRAISY